MMKTLMLLLVVLMLAATFLGGWKWTPRGGGPQGGDVHAGWAWDGRDTGQHAGWAWE